MHKRDYLVKQFEEFGKVMAILLGLKREGNYPEFIDLINQSVKKYTSTEIDFVESINNELLITTLTLEKKLNDEQLKILADLLFEKADYYSNILQNSTTEIQAINCYKKSHLIYLFLSQHATLSYSLDMHYKLEILGRMDL
jgi:hypothetical protein